MEYHSVPQPEEIDIRQRDDAMGAYFMMFATTAIGLPLPILNLLASIIYYYVNKAKGRFVQFHMLQSLYSQIPISIINMGLIVWFFRNLIGEQEFTSYFWGYLVMTGLANLLYFIFSIVGAVRANKGRFYYFLFFGKLAFHVVYLVRADLKSGELVNKPPKM